jgi:hypothetical protein
MMSRPYLTRSSARPRRELDEIDRYNAIRAKGRTMHSQRSLSGHARRQVSEYTRLERRPRMRGGTPSWSSLTGLGWLIVGGCMLAMVAIVVLLMVMR